jgi:hypothetical protein
VPGRELGSGPAASAAALGFGPSTRKLAPQGQRITFPSTRSDACSDRPHDGHVNFRNMQSPFGCQALIVLARIGNRCSRLLRLACRFRVYREPPFFSRKEPSNSYGS